MEVENPETPAESLAAVFDELEPTESETVEDSVSEEVSEEAVAESVDVEEVEDPTEDSPIEDNEESVEPETVFQAPEHWSSEDREAFEALSADAAELVLKFEGDFKRGYQEKVEAIAAIQQAIEPWNEALTMRGVTPDQAIRTLFAAQARIEQNPVQGILEVAQSFGVVDQLREQFSPATDEDDFTDPEIKALRQEIAELKSVQQQTSTASEEQARNQLIQRVNDFQNEKDDAGSPKHPYFEKVRHLMAPLVSQGKSLEDAYNEAVWAVPEYRESAVKPVAEDPVKDAAKVRKAKKAARSVKPPSGKPNESSEDLSLRDALAQSWNQLS